MEEEPERAQSVCMFAEELRGPCDDLPSTRSSIFVSGIALYVDVDVYWSVFRTCEPHRRTREDMLNVRILAKLDPDFRPQQRVVKCDRAPVGAYMGEDDSGGDGVMTVGCRRVRVDELEDAHDEFRREDFYDVHGGQEQGSIEWA